MSLPKFHLPRETVEIDGEFIEIRGLTAAETARFEKMVATGAAWDQLEIGVIAAGTETPEDEIAIWYQDNPRHVATALSNAIRRISRVDEEARKSGGEGDRAGGG